MSDEQCNYVEEHKEITPATIEAERKLCIDELIYKMFEVPEYHVSALYNTTTMKPWGTEGWKNNARHIISSERYRRTATKVDEVQQCHHCFQRDIEYKKTQVVRVYGNGRGTLQFITYHEECYIDLMRTLAELANPFSDMFYINYGEYKRPIEHHSEVHRVREEVMKPKFSNIWIGLFAKERLIPIISKVDEELGSQLEWGRSVMQWKSPKGPSGEFDMNEIRWNDSNLGLADAGYRILNDERWVHGNVDSDTLSRQAKLDADISKLIFDIAKNCHIMKYDNNVKTEDWLVALNEDHVKNLVDVLKNHRDNYYSLPTKIWNDETNTWEETTVGD